MKAKQEASNFIKFKNHPVPFPQINFPQIKISPNFRQTTKLISQPNIQPGQYLMQIIGFSTQFYESGLVLEERVSLSKEI